MSSASAAASDASFPLGDPELFEAMAAPPAKKARIEAPKSFKDINLDALTLKEVQGKDELVHIPLMDNETIRFMLTPDEPTRIVCGFDMLGVVEQRSFNVKGLKGKGTESLSIRVAIDDEQIEFLEKLDAKLFALYGVDKAIWSPIIARNDKYEKPTVSIKVCLKGDESALTLLKFKQGDVVERDFGWDFLKAQADIEKSKRNAFTGAEVKTILKVRGYRFVNEKGKEMAGISLVANDMFIKPKPRVIIDFIEDW